MADVVADGLRRMGVDVTVELTNASGDAGMIAHEASTGPDVAHFCVAACGGDGTIQEVAGALARRCVSGDADVPSLGLIPAGRCNDFARALGVPLDADGITSVLAGGTPRPIDLGKVNDRYFCTVATAGIDAEVSRFVDGMRLPLTGTPAYLYGAVRVLMGYEAPCMVIEGDFGRVEGRFFLASSANTSSYGGAIPIAPGAVPTDGLLDVCLIRAMSKLRAVSFVPIVLRGRHAKEPEVRLLKSKSLRIESAKSIELWADGEQIAETPAHIEIVPSAVRVLLP